MEAHVGTCLAPANKFFDSSLSVLISFFMLYMLDVDECAVDPAVCERGHHVSVWEACFSKRLQCSFCFCFPFSFCRWRRCGSTLTDKLCGKLAEVQKMAVFI